MNTHKNSYMPPHVGEYIQEELEAREWSQQDLAYILGKDSSYINKILAEKHGVSPEMAKALAKAFDMSPEFFLNLQKSYDLATRGAFWYNGSEGCLHVGDIST